MPTKEKTPKVEEEAAKDTAAEATEEKAAEPKPEETKQEAKKEEVPEVSEADRMKLMSEAERTKYELSKCPKAQFICPLGPGEKAGSYETVTINSYRLTIKKGCLVELPMPVIEILAEHYKVSLEAGQDKLVNRSDEIKRLLTKSR